ncbi:MAG: transporter substrate-binding domain-containing protein [Candidatus Magnetomorum sp.]|nr:transporter substrate-binding domain-containing protein [Candidatus Magnetomorum sp.]
MKKISIFVFIVITLFSHSLLAEETLVLAAGEWPPYTSENMDNKGFMTEIVTQILKEMNLQAEIKFYPWRRCYEYVMRDKVFAAFPYSFTAERAQEVLFSDDIAFSTSKFFYYSASAEKPVYKYEKIEDIRHYKIGAVIGYYYEEQFKKEKLTVDYVAKESIALEKLFLGRTQLFPLDEMVGWELIKKTFPDQVTNFGTLEKPLDRSSLKLIINKDNKKTLRLLKMFNHRLELFKKSSQYQSILKQYSGL